MTLTARLATEVAVVRGVPAGSVCAIDVDLAAGHYVAREGDRDVEFDVVATTSSSPDRRT